MTYISLQPACSALLSDIKIPSYFQKYSKGLSAVVKVTYLHIPNFELTTFRIWQSFNLSSLSNHEKNKLKKLEPIPNNPIHQLRAQISDLAKYLTLDTNEQSWIYIMGGGGSGLFPVLLVGVCLY